MSTVHKVLTGILAILVILSVLNAMQYARLATAFQFGISFPEALLHLIGRDKHPNGTAIYSGKPLVYWESASNEFVFHLGSWYPGTNKSFTAAFGIVNEEQYKIVIREIRVEPAVAGQYMQIWLHANPRKECTWQVVNASFTGIPGVAPNYPVAGSGPEDTITADSGTHKALMWCGSGTRTPSGIPGMGVTGQYWILVAGDGNQGTYDYNGVSTGYSNATYNDVYKLVLPSDTVTNENFGDAIGNYNVTPKTAPNNTADYVWVEIALLIPGDATLAPSITGRIYIEIASIDIFEVG